MTTHIQNEKKRLKALHSYNILDSEETLEFDNLAKLAAQICDVPLAKINFLDEKRQWSKANCGNNIKEMAREDSFCTYTIFEDEYMMVEDASKDDRFSNHAHVKSDPKLRFYAGVNIKGYDENIGTICVLGQEPKQLSESQLNALKTLANEVEARLELRRKNKELQNLTAFLEASVDLILIVEPKSLQIEKFNRNNKSIFDSLTQEDCLQPIHKIFPEWDYIRKIQNWDKSGARGSFKTETSLKYSGETIHLYVSAIKEQGKWLITAKNITKRKNAEEELKREKKLSDAIINSLPVDFYMFDERQKLIRWNENMIKNTGYSKNEVGNLHPNDFFQGDDVERIQKEIQNTMKGAVSHLEANLVKKDGSTEPFLFNAATFESNGEKFLIGTGESIAEQKSYQKMLENLLAEKEVLLSEVHHRVKNNLAVISGFLQMEELIQEDERTKSVLLSNHMRVKSMALIHEELYNVANFSGIRFDQYLTRLLSYIQEKKSPADKKVKLKSDIEQIELNLNQAVPLALIINELVSNAYKFAFEGRSSGTITVKLSKIGQEIQLLIKDDGIGLPENFILEKSPTLGATLVLSYSEQINSDFNISTENGTEYQLRFKNNKALKGSSMNAFV